MTALFAPADKRETLFVLYAFNHEIARARDVASQPMLALIRLQWWREVVQGAARPHEIATPLRTEIAEGRLDADLLTHMIDAREAEAEDILDEPAWAAYLAGAGGALMRAAGAALGAETPALGEAGAACAAVALLRNQHAYAATGRWYGPEARDAAWVSAWAMERLAPQRQWPQAAIPAALPLVQARRHLRRLEARSAKPDPWARLAVWAAARRGLF